MAQTSVARASLSASSSPCSFYTANVSEADQSTTASSPVQGPASTYRDARALPRELKEHCQIFLEEQLYTCAINLLNSILSSGTSRRNKKTKPVPVPPPSHLSLLATIAIHPLHTTRVEKADHLDVSSLALDYLRNLLIIVGPLNADFRAAFQFRSVPRWSRRSGYNDRGTDSEFSDTDVDHDSLRGKIANEGSVWNRGQDFWSTVGWAFNCSTLYPHRWRYWRCWLSFMLDVLDADWNERERRDLATHEANGKTGDIPTTLRAESMIQMYLDEQSGRMIGFKRILKALFADGGSMSSSSFREVFEKEPRGPKKGTTNKRKREQVLDLENDKFGDYFDDDSISSGISEPPTPQKPRETRRDIPFGASNAPLIESIDLRLRLFRLISAATYTLGKRSQLNKLYEDYAVAIKVLPLPMYSLFITQRPNALLFETHITITKELFQLLIATNAKLPRKVDPEGDATGSLTMKMLEHCYISYAANNSALDDNSKVSLLVENAIQLLWMCDMFEYSDSLAQAAENGIQARKAMAKTKRTGKMKTADHDVFAQDVLSNSAERIRVLLQTLKTCGEREM